MSELLDWLQVLLGAATLAVTVFALLKGDSPPKDGESTQNNED